MWASASIDLGGRRQDEISTRTFHRPARPMAWCSPPATLATDGRQPRRQPVLCIEPLSRDQQANPKTLVDRDENVKMATPYPFHSRLLSPAHSQPHSHSSPASSPSALSDSTDENDSRDNTSFTPSIDQTLNRVPVFVDGPRSMNLHFLRGYTDEHRLARLRYLDRNDPVPEPQSPPRHDEFPDKTAQCGPKNEDKVKNSPVDGPRWSDAEYPDSLSSTWKPRFPPSIGCVVKTHLKDEQNVSKPLVGFAHKLNWIVELNRAKKSRLRGLPQGVDRAAERPG